MLSVGVFCRVPFIATRCVSNWSMHSSTGGGGPEMGLEWALEGLERGYKIWWMVLCGAKAVWLTVVVVCREHGRGLISWFSLFRMTPGFMVEWMVLKCMNYCLVLCVCGGWSCDR